MAKKSIKFEVEKVRDYITKEWDHNAQKGLEEYIEIPNTS